MTNQQPPPCTRAPCSWTPCTWAVVPAAGEGIRMGNEIPKQYLQINNKTILQHTLEHLISSSLNNIVVAVSPTDERWRELPLVDHKKLKFVEGGDSRIASVLCGLEAVKKDQTRNSWVMVHDAVRPCVRTQDIEKLIKRICGDRENKVGGLLALRITDTLKKARHRSGAAPNEVERTVDRDRYWCALTPQIFRLGILHEAIVNAMQNEAEVTDEAGAMELLGYTPLLVEGSSDNIKVTYPGDLRLAEFYLSLQEQEQEQQQR